MSRTTAAALAALTLVACGKGCTPRSRGASPIDLAPLPEAPPLQIAPEALPGAGGELAVVAARPQGPMEGDVRPTITFSKPVVAMGSVEYEKGLPTPIVITPRLEGEWRWLGSATTEFVPKGLVPYATAFQVIVPKGLRAVDGSELAAEYVFSFETPRPLVQQVDPSPQHPGGFRWLTARQVITLTFNQPVKDLAAHLKLEVGGKAWAVEVKETKLADERRDAERGRRFARMGFEERGFRNRQTRYEVTPRAAMPLDAPVRLGIDGPLTGAEGPLVLEGNPSWSWRTYGPFRIEGVDACWWRSDDGCPHGPVRLRTTNRVDVKALAKAITITPKVEIDWENDVEVASQTELHLPAVFKAGTKYRIAVSRDARDEFGQPLEKPFEGTFETDDVSPVYDVGNTLALVEAKGDGALPVSGTNVSKVDVKVVPLDPSGLARVLASEPPESFYDQGIPVTVALSAKRNQPRTAPLPLRDLLAAKKATLFALRTDAPDVKVSNQWDRWRRWKRVTGQVTDLSVHAKVGATKGLVWVTRLSEERGQHGDVVPFALLSAESGGDVGVTLSHWTGGFEPYAFGGIGDWEGNVPRALGGVFAERGIYRPGESVHVKGIALAEAREAPHAHVRHRAGEGDELARQGGLLARRAAHAVRDLLRRGADRGGRPARRVPDRGRLRRRRRAARVARRLPGRGVPLAAVPGGRGRAGAAARRRRRGEGAGARALPLRRRDARRAGPLDRRARVHRLRAARERRLLVRRRVVVVGRRGAAGGVRRRGLGRGRDRRDRAARGGGGASGVDRREDLRLHGRGRGDGREPAADREPHRPHRPPGVGVRGRAPAGHRLRRGGEGRCPRGRRRRAGRRAEGGGGRRGRGEAARVEVDPQARPRRHLARRDRGPGGEGGRLQGDDGGDPGRVHLHALEARAVRGRGDAPGREGAHAGDPLPVLRHRRGLGVVAARGDRPARPRRGQAHVRAGRDRPGAREEPVPRGGGGAHR